MQRDRQFGKKGDSVEEKKAGGWLRDWGRGKTLRGKKWENKQRSQERESRISSKGEEGRAGGKRLAVLNGNLHVCVWACTVAACVTWPRLPLACFVAQSPLSPLTHSHTIAALWPHTHTRTHAHRSSPLFPFHFHSHSPPHLQACVAAFCGWHFSRHT